MLQRGLLTIAEKQQQLQQTQPPYDKPNATATTTAHEANLLKEQEEHLSIKSNKRQELNENFRERINCLPIIELPQIKIEQDVEYMEGIEEEAEEEPNEIEQQAMSHADRQSEEPQNMQADEEAEEGDAEEKEDLSLQPVAQLLEPTSILKTSLLTGAANTLATLTAAAEQIARMPNECLTKSYAYTKEENKRTYALEDETKTTETDENKSNTAATTTYTSILQTALMSKRPATLNVAATLSTASSSSTSSTSYTCAKSLHVRTPDQVLKTAVTLATLGEIAAQQEQLNHQLHQQQQQQQQQQPHILVVPQVQRKTCTLPFKKLNFANVTTSTSAATSAPTTSVVTNTAPTHCNTTSTETSASAAAAVSSASATATNTTITNNYLGSNNIKTNTYLTNSSCILNTNNLAASITNKRDKLETATATFFDTNNHHIINNVTKCSRSSSSSSNSNNNSSININNNTNLKSQTMATQTLKIPTIKPQLVTTQTQTEETATQTQIQIQTPAAPSSLMIPFSLATTLTNSSASSLQTASSSGLLRTAVSANTKMLTQNSSTSSSASAASLNSLTTNKFPTKTNLETNENKATTLNVANNVLGNIYKHVSDNNKTTTLAKMNVIQQSNAVVKTNAGPTTGACENNASGTANPATNVTVVVFETLLPED